MGLKYLDKNSYKYFHKQANKLYAIHDVVKICERVLIEEKVDWKKEQQLGLVFTVACILNAPPFGFGKKRLTRFFKLLFDQSIWVNEHPEDTSLVVDTIRNVGLKFAYKDNILTMVDADMNRIGENLNENGGRG